MKKTLAIILVLILALSCVVLAGCGGGGSNESTTPPEDSQYIGTWQATKTQIGDEIEDIGDTLGEKPFIITLNADGTASVDYEEGAADGTWKETKDGFKIEGGDTDLKFKYEDGVAKIGMLGFNIIFEKQD